MSGIGGFTLITKIYWVYREEIAIRRIKSSNSFARENLQVPPPCLLEECYGKIENGQLKL